MSHRGLRIAAAYHALGLAAKQRLIDAAHDALADGVYLRGYESVPELERGLRANFAFYNGERLHQSLGYRTPAEAYSGGGRSAGEG